MAGAIAIRQVLAARAYGILAEVGQILKRERDHRSRTPKGNESVANLKSFLR
jgi:hypothetical protein